MRKVFRKCFSFLVLIFFICTLVGPNEYHRLVHHFKESIHSHSLVCLWSGIQQKSSDESTQSTHAQIKDETCDVLQSLKSIEGSFALTNFYKIITLGIGDNKSTFFTSVHIPDKFDYHTYSIRGPPASI